MDDAGLCTGEDVEELTRRLSVALTESEEYRNYRRTLDALKKDEELYGKVNELRRNNYYLQNAGASKMTNEEYMGISGFSKSLHENPLVDEFLNAETALARLIQSVMGTMMEKIDFDIDFL